MDTAKQTIVIFSPGYFPTVGGAERQAQLLAERWVSQGQPVWVLTKREHGLSRHETLNGVSVRRCWIPSIPGLAWFIFGAAIFHLLFKQKKQIKCLFVPMFNTQAFLCAIAARLLHVPCLIRPSAGGLDGNLDKMQKSFLGSLKTTLTLNNLSYLIAINEQIKSEFLELDNVNPMIIPNGVDTEFYSAPSDSSRQKFRQDLNLSPHHVAVLFVGRLDPVKNLETVLSVWKDVVEKNPNALLLLAGVGPARKKLEALCADKKITGQVRFLGDVSTPRDIYQACDIFVLPSHREGMSNSLLEAMACGLPPIVSGVRGNRAVIPDPAAGIFCDPKDAEAWRRALTELVQNSSRRQSVGVRAREIVQERFSIAVTIKQYDALIETLSRPFFKQPFPILAYHRVCTPPRYGIDVSVQEFDRQMSWLARNGYSTMSLSEFFDFWKEARPFPSKKVVITFDDGHKDTYQNAYPILKKYEFRATLFLNSGLLEQRFWVGGRHPAPVQWHSTQPADFDPASQDWRVYEFMSWDEANELANAGFEIGSHAVTHPFLTQLSPSELNAQLRDSKKEIEAKLHRTVNFFCYPSGDYDARVQEAAREAGYDGAVVTANHYRLNYYWDDPFALERIGIWQDVAFWKFKALVKGWYPCIYRAIPSNAWGTIRKVYRALR